MLAMDLANIPFQTIDWTAVVPTRHPGETGHSLWRTVEVGNARIRIVEYTPGYVADHWCERGHVVYVLDGELTSELRDGRSFVVRTGESYVVASGDGAHRSRTGSGARLLIVD